MIFLGFSLVLTFKNYFLTGFPWFSGLKIVLVGLLAMAWGLMSWDLPGHLLVTGSVLSVPPPPG